MTRVISMVTLLRRVFWLAVLGGAGFAGWSAWSRRKSSATGAPPEWPPIEPPTTSPTTSPTDALADAPAVSQPSAKLDVTLIAALQEAPSAHSTLTWVAPDGGSCPESHPIKANSNSGIFHVPGGRFYNQTRAERCYGVAEDAEADGYRRAKS